MVNKGEAIKPELVVLEPNARKLPGSESPQFLDALNRLRRFRDQHNLPVPSNRLLDRIETLHHAELVFADFADREADVNPLEERDSFPSLQSISRVVAQLDAELRETADTAMAQAVAEAAPPHWGWPVMVGVLAAIELLLMWRGIS